MPNFLNIATISGFVLTILGLTLVPLRFWLKKRLQVGSLAQDVLISLVHLLCGVTLAQYGFQVNPLWQFCFLLLTISIIFWVIKDLSHKN
jgi:hypothetical protein